MFLITEFNKINALEAQNISGVHAGILALQKPMRDQRPGYIFWS